jgi:hypothetical protein
MSDFEQQTVIESDDTDVRVRGRSTVMPWVLFVRSRRAGAPTTCHEVAGRPARDERGARRRRGAGRARRAAQRLASLEAEG